MQVTDVKIRNTYDSGKLKAIVSVTLDNMLAIHDMRIIENEGQLFIAMPSRLTPSGEHRDIVHPINREMRRTLEEAVFAAYHSNERASGAGGEPKRDCAEEG